MRLGWSKRERLGWLLLLAGIFVLPLEGAFTIEIGYTVRASYGLFLAACIVHPEGVIAGWRRMPRALAVAAVILIGAYVLSTLLTEQQTLAGSGRAGEGRAALYLVDLALGLSLLGLAVAKLSVPSRRVLATGAFVLGAFAASVFAIYQWPALHFGWPLSDFNNALNTDGATRGATSNATGLLGWSRPRSTFLEPTFLAAFLTISVPLAIGHPLPGFIERRRYLRPSIVIIMVAALGLTLSAPAWLALAAGGLTATTIFLVARGRATLAATAALVTAVIVLTGVAAATQPGSFAAVTGREATSLEISGGERTDAWRAAVAAWEERPVLGFGAGQAAVLLANAKDRLRIGPRVAQTEVLGTAHGIWAASLVDTGLIGFCAWIVLIVAALAQAIRLLISAGSPGQAAALAAVIASLASSIATGDRLGLSTWMALALVLAYVAEARRAAGAGEPKANAVLV